MKRKAIDVNEEIWRKVKAAALLDNKPLSRWIEEAFLSKLNGKNEKN